MNRTVVRTGPVLIEKLRDGYSKEECEAGDDKVSHRVHVCELKK